MPSSFPSTPPELHVLRRAFILGHGAEVRAALDRLEMRLRRGAVTSLGPLAPDTSLCELYRRRGMLEGAAEEYRAPTHTVVVPLTGLPKACLRKWKESGHELLDLTLPAVKRAQTSLGLLSLEHGKPVVIGWRDSAEAAAIAGEIPGTVVAEDPEQASLLPFAPKFGLVCQTTFSRRRAHAVAEAIRLRHPDSRLVFLDTTTPAMLERERSVEGLSRWAETIIVAGEAGESSVRALLDASRRLGLPAHAVADAGSLNAEEFAKIGRIGLTAGEFSPDAVLDAIEGRLQTERD